MAAAVVGLAIPILPQIPFFLAGLALLGSVSPRARLTRTRLRARIRQWREKRAARRGQKRGRKARGS